MTEDEAVFGGQRNMFDGIQRYFTLNAMDDKMDGEYHMYDGGTSQDEMRDAPNAINTLFLQPW